LRGMELMAAWIQGRRHGSPVGEEEEKVKKILMRSFLPDAPYPATMQQRTLKRGQDVSDDRHIIWCSSNSLLSAD
jgi:hypothetical protein